MDINTSLNLNVQQLLAASKTPLLQLKLNQQIDVKLLSVDLLTNTLTLAAGDNTLQTQAPATLPPQLQLTPGMTLTLQVVRLSPQPEFKLLTNPDPPPAALTTAPASANSTLPAATYSSPSVPTSSSSPPLPATAALATTMPVALPSTSAAVLNPIPSAAITSNPGATPLHDVTLKLLKIIPTADAQSVPTTINNRTSTGATNSIAPSMANHAIVQQAQRSVDLATTSAPGNRPSAALASSANPVPLPVAVSSKQLPLIAPDLPLNAKVVTLDSKTVQLLVTLPAHVTRTPIQSNPNIPANAAASNSTTQTPVNTTGTVIPPARPTTLLVSVPLQDVKLGQLGNPVTTPSVLAQQANINAQFAAKTPILQPGNNVQISVLQQHGKTEFIVRPNLDITLDKQQITAALREQLPKQASPVHLLQQLLQQLPALQQNANVSETLKQLAQKILLTLPDSKALANPVVLQQTIHDAGVFLEAKLAQLPTDAAPDFSGDLKANLLKLHASIKETPTANNVIEDDLKAKTEALPELQQKTEHSLAKIVLDQLSSLPKEESSKQIWHLEIPYAHNEQLHKLDLSIERDSSGASGDEQQPHGSNWSVTLSITPPGLDTIHCKIIFANHTVNTYFRSENSQTSACITENMAYLRAQFEAHGLTAGHMDAHTGNFPQPMQEKITQQQLFYGKA